MKTEPAADAIPWHSVPAGEALRTLGSRSEGLSEEEAAERLDRYGPNRMPEARQSSVPQIFLRQFASPLIYLLLAAGCLSLLIGDRRDAFFIFVVLVLNALVGAFQEWRADTSARALRSLVPQLTTVRRTGAARPVPTHAVVPGDIVELESGMRVPADLRLLDAHGFSVDEAALTGESLPVAKDPQASVDPDASLADRPTVAHAGTMVAQGRSVGLVVATGMNTAVGQIERSLLDISRARHGSPLLRRMRQLARQIAVGSLGLIFVLSVLLALQGQAWGEIALLAVALAVSAIPEGLPVAVTVALSVAARRMARRNVIVRLLPAVEGLGSVTLIATDKTGTLTENSLSVERIVVPGGVAFDRADWECDGPLPAELRRLGMAVALCNEARLDPDGKAAGDAVDVALVDFSARTGHDAAALLSKPRLGVIPYEPAQRFAAAEVAVADGEAPLLVVKGAPETVLPMTCGIDSWAAQAADDLAREGFRVLVLAERRRSPGAIPIDADLRGLEVVGLVGLADPLRPGVPEAVRRCLSAGISVRMLTGDHPATALAIARQTGIAEHPDEVVSGHELRQLQGDAAAFDQIVAAARVFARIEPTQKLAIVRALQAHGEIVAVTGDGVNDGPALEAADIGVSMGRGGTDVARGASDLILVDDNFASIVAGVEEGRVIILNVRRMVLFLLATGVAEIGMFLAALAVGLPMPLTPVQLLWLNLVTNGVQDVTLGFGHGEGDELGRPRGRGLAALIDREAVVLLGVTAATMTGLATWLFAGELRAGADLQEARNSVLLLVVLFQNALLLSLRHLRHPVWRLLPQENPWLLAGIAAALTLHVAAMHIPPMQVMLGIAPVTADLLVRCIAAALLLVAVAEAVKRLKR